jgi:L-aspartate oxidase
MRELQPTGIDFGRLAPSITHRFPVMPERDIRSVAWNSCGILRSGPELNAAFTMLRSRERIMMYDATRADFEQRTIHLIALLISFAALAREESRGAHYRIDFPNKLPELAKHSIVTRSPSTGELEIRFA